MFNTGLEWQIKVWPILYVIRIMIMYYELKINIKLNWVKIKGILNGNEKDMKWKGNEGIVLFTYIQLIRKNLMKWILNVWTGGEMEVKKRGK